MDALFIVRRMQEEYQMKKTRSCMCALLTLFTWKRLLIEFQEK